MSPHLTLGVTKVQEQPDCQNCELHLNCQCSYRLVHLSGILPAVEEMPEDIHSHIKSLSMLLLL